jgi:hypothetical protein
MTPRQMMKVYRAHKFSREEPGGQTL